MIKKYNHKAVEKKWQKYWEDKNIWQADDKASGEKFYVLDMFPYPSAEGLHVGHPEGYTVSDIITRYQRMNGKNVLRPMGFDSFGLPAENYAIKTGTHPAKTTAKNIDNMRKQIKSLGFAYDWDREVVTSDPSYYKWTQWIFIQLFKHGLAYEADAPINWCPSCKTGLANEEVVNGKCERCNSEVTKKQIKQWLVKITDDKYIERLEKDLDNLDWPDSIKNLQRNWIGRSEGAEVNFRVIASEISSDSNKDTEITTSSSTLRNDIIKAFTTRSDTLFGATYMVLSPEHELVNQITTDKQHQEVHTYQKQASGKSDLERTDLAKDKTGVFTGAFAINPVNKEKIPIWIADYVLSSYGTGAIMAVPAHDKRDFEFATKFNLPIVEVVKPLSPSIHLPTGAGGECYVGEGVAINSGEFNGLTTKEFKKKITKWLEENKVGKKAVNYKLRDWLFSRQRYWGEPIPIIHCKKCGQVAVPEEDLPVELPDIKKYEPTGTGESPLASIDEWVNIKCPECGGKAKRETNTMPQWAGSNWYFLRYCDPHNDKMLADPEKLSEWLPVDLYIGGAEHAVLHLLYARFIYKFLFDIGTVPKEIGDEPFVKLKNQGLIMGEDGVKMSKSRGNVINPDDVVKEYGADTLRMYEMFMGPFEDSKPWDTKGIIGIKRFLDRVWDLGMYKEVKLNSGNKEPKIFKQLEIQLHKAVKKVTEDINNFRFNTAISELMIVSKIAWSNKDFFSDKQKEILLKLLSPFAPHITEELWEMLGNKDSISKEKWPKYDPEKLKITEVIYVVQVNGKRRDEFKIQDTATEKMIIDQAKASYKVSKYLTSEPKKVIFVPGKLINFVV